jgi:hypothetical protein
MDDIAKEYLTELVHNEKVRKNMQTFIKTGKLLDDNGDELDLGSTVNYKLSKEIKE